MQSFQKRTILFWLPSILFKILLSSCFSKVVICYDYCYLLLLFIFFCFFLIMFWFFGPIWARQATRGASNRSNGSSRCGGSGWSVLQTITRDVVCISMSFHCLPIMQSFYHTCRFHFWLFRHYVFYDWWFFYFAQCFLEYVFQMIFFISARKFYVLLRWAILVKCMVLTVSFIWYSGDGGRPAPPRDAPAAGGRVPWGPGCYLRPLRDQTPPNRSLTFTNTLHIYKLILRTHSICGLLGKREEGGTGTWRWCVDVISPAHAQVHVGAWRR